MPLMLMLATVTPANVWSTWTFDPSVIVAIALAGSVYAVGARNLRSRGHARVASAGRISCFAAGLLLMAVALLSPLDAMSQALFSAHMTQHLIIGLIAPLFIVCGRPIVIGSAAFRPAVQHELRNMSRDSARALHVRRSSVPLALGVVLAHALTWWVAHTPTVYDATIRNSTLHAAEHFVLFVTGLAFWWIIVAIRWKERSAAAVLYLFIAGLQAGALAALLTVAPRPLFDVHTTAATLAWHLTPLEDQQLAGGIMWVPGGIVYAGVAIVLFVRWLQSGPIASGDDDRRHRAIVFAPGS